jgi:TolB-like protein
MNGKWGAARAAFRVIAFVVRFCLLRYESRVTETCYNATQKVQFMITGAVARKKKHVKIF